MAEAGTLIRDNPPMDEVERLVHLFVHDLRAPLGVATGYLRLLQDGRLGTELDQRMALTRTLDALGRIAALCDAMANAGAEVEDSGRLAPEDLVLRVGAALKPPAEFDSPDEWPSGFSVAVGRDGDRFAKAIALVINAMARRGVPAPRLRVSGDGNVLRFALNPQAESLSATSGPFDPWRGFGLEVVLACQTIQATGGRVRTGDGADLIIELPLLRLEAQ